MGCLKDYPQLMAPLAQWHLAWSYLHPDYTLDQLVQEMQQYLSPQLLPSMCILLNRQQQLLGSASLVAHDLGSRPELGNFSCLLPPGWIYRSLGWKTLDTQQVQGTYQPIMRLDLSWLMLSCGIKLIPIKLSLIKLNSNQATLIQSVLLKTGLINAV